MLTQILDTYMAERQFADNDTRDNSKFRVSDAGKCRLMRYWKRQGKKSTVSWTPDTLRAMQLGINIHEFIQKIVTALPCGIKRAVCEQHLEDKHRIGHYDLFLELSEPIQNPDFEKDITTLLYDFKTKGSKSWHYWNKDGRQVDQTHECQIVTYWLMMPPDDHIDQCRIAYINRDTFEIDEWPVHHQCFVEMVEIDWSILTKAWEQQEEPAPSPANSWECKYCMYRNDCEHAKGYYLV